jgi:hypothetical protein
MELNGWLHTQVTSIPGENILEFFGFDNVSLMSHSDIKKNIFSVTFNGNQSMNKISYLGLEWNPNSLVAKLTALLLC